MVARRDLGVMHTTPLIALLAGGLLAGCAHATPHMSTPAAVTPSPIAAPAPAPDPSGRYEWEMLGSSQHEAVVSTGGQNVIGTLEITPTATGYEGVLTSSIGPRVFPKAVTVTGARATMLLDSPFGEVRFDWPLGPDKVGPWWTLTIRPGDSVGGGLVIVRKGP
jgi:hypothetical protein